MSCAMRPEVRRARGRPPANWPMAVPGPRDHRTRTVIYALIMGGLGARGLPEVQLPRRDILWGPAIKKTGAHPSKGDRWRGRRRQGARAVVDCRDYLQRPEGGCSQSAGGGTYSTCGQIDTVRNLLHRWGGVGAGCKRRGVMNETKFVRRAFGRGGGTGNGNDRHGAPIRLAQGEPSVGRHPGGGPLGREGRAAQDCTVGGRGRAGHSAQHLLSSKVVRAVGKFAGKIWGGNPGAPVFDGRAGRGGGGGGTKPKKGVEALCADTSSN